MANDIEQFLEKHADANGNVSEEAMARLLTGDIEGDTAAAPAVADTGAPAAGTEASTDAPAAAPAAPAPAPAAPAPAPAPADAPTAAPAATPAPAAAPAVAEADSVILAKDGKHTIPYQKLVSAREEAKSATARAEQAERDAAQLREQLAKATTAPAAAPASAAAPAAASDLFGDFSDQALKKGVESLVADALGKFKSEVNADIEPVKRQVAESAAETHFRTIYTKHPDTDSIVESAEYQQWLAAQPSLVRQTYETVLSKGTASQVVEMLDTYKAARPAPATAPAPAPAPAPVAAPAPAVDPQKKADQVVASVKSKTPTSLTDVPAGSQVHHDEAEAMAEMSPLDLMAKFEGKTPSQIEALMRKLV